jgi:hypothetical protein
VNITLAIARINPACCHYLLGRQARASSLFRLHGRVYNNNAARRPARELYSSESAGVIMCLPPPPRRNDLLHGDARGPTFALQIYALCSVSVYGASMPCFAQHTHTHSKHAHVRLRLFAD